MMNKEIKTPRTREDCIEVLDRVYDLLESIKYAIPDDLEWDVDHLMNGTFELTEAVRDWQSEEDRRKERAAFESWLWQQVM